MTPAVLFAALALGGADDEKFEPLFNGQNLDGWVNVNCAPGTFSARDGIIVSTGVPTGVIRTEKMYENFVMELEWKHVVPKGNAGLFVFSDALTAPGTPFTRSIEIQVMDGIETPDYTSHGDIFSIHGARCIPDRPHPNGWARCLPLEKRCKPAGEWNHYRVECNDGRITLAVNGKVVSGVSECYPKKGYICLEAEGTECHFRNLRIRELPGSATAEESARANQEGFRPLYTGLDTANFKADGEWKPSDWKLVGSGMASLESEEAFGANSHIIIDVRMAEPPEGAKAVGYEVVFAPGEGGKVRAPDLGEKWHRLEIVRDATGSAQIRWDGQDLGGKGPSEPAPLRIKLMGGQIEVANVLVRSTPGK